MDAITVALALHWFDVSKFWSEISRIARPNALFIAWAYHDLLTDEDITSVILGPIRERIVPYWSEGNRLSWRGYPIEEVGMPFIPITTPHFSIRVSWTPQQILKFVSSWSAHQRARLDGHEDSLKKIEDEALSRLDHRPRRIIMPLKTLAGRVLP